MTAQPKIDDSHFVFSVLLRDMLSTPGRITVMVSWKTCQWSNDDDTIEELFEMFRHHGTPAAIEFSKAEGDPTP